LRTRPGRADLQPGPPIRAVYARIGVVRSASRLHPRSSGFHPTAMQWDESLINKKNGVDAALKRLSTRASRYRNSETPLACRAAYRPGFRSLITT